MIGELLKPYMKRLSGQSWNILVYIWDYRSKLRSNSIETYLLRAPRIVTDAKKGTSHDRLNGETQWSKLKEKRNI